MAQIGNLGSLITFEVSSDKVLTFSNLTQTVKGRWASHAPIGGKPYSEFLGSDVRSLSVPIYLSATCGVRPRKTLESIEDAVENGTPLSFVVGGKKIGKYEWKITQMSETWGAVFEDGRLASVNVTLTLEEYR